MKTDTIKLRLVRQRYNEYVILFPNKVKLVVLNSYYYSQLLNDCTYEFINTIDAH